jgi:hypothetical protein
MSGAGAECVEGVEGVAGAKGVECVAGVSPTVVGPPSITYYNPPTSTYDDTIVVFVFLGRGNPPQKAHYKIISDMILEAKKHNTCALLLIGAGPRYEQKADNPISYKERSLFLDNKLKSDNFQGGIIPQPPQSDYANKKVTNGDYHFFTTASPTLFKGDYAIMMKNNSTTSSDIVEYVKTYVEKSGKYKDASTGTFPKLKIVQCAGMKEGDATKLAKPDGIFNTAVDKLRKLPLYFTSVEFNVWAFDVISINDTALSATAVRENARDIFHTYTGRSENIALNLAFKLWKSHYDNFYDEVTLEFFKQMIFGPNGRPYPRVVDTVTDGSKQNKTNHRSKGPYGKGGSRRKRTRKHRKTFRSKRTIRNRRRRYTRRRRT